MELGIVVRPELAPEQLADHVARAEAAGFDEVWLWEDCFLVGGIAGAATALAATRRATIGLGVLPAPARNAAFAAMELAALARLHPGRLHAGLGHGVADWMRQVGAKPASQLALLEEMTAAVRALLAGERVRMEGRYVRLRDVALDHPPAAPPPVSLGVRGAKSLELSGRVADGTVLDSLSTPAYVRWARERIDAGRAAAGRTGGHRVTVYAFCATDAVGEAAIGRAAAQAAGAQAEFVAGRPLPELAVVGDAATARASLAALADAGADCVVLVAPEAGRALDPGAVHALVR